ncbi:iron-sulfur cluster biosynthesis family protein [Bacillus sp. WLY-B-L8]|uniref:iron-sulfur cluster biosynthesis family protein n=1 Tax=Bacillus multifaciens TaxID=3068506 RepID=UPI0027408074|nr:iron-sulfur cluster biosynthesis family protein [Bacillus sp. WLY-B-L8]MDP7978147.1 iron-sulfur cluster biosynthesis family protein [Bacillus sp. WLY-B-L8]HDX9591064.1 Fe-S cluster assembly protein HesB [Bacillus pseudomycoides]
MNIRVTNIAKEKLQQNEDKIIVRIKGSIGNTCTVYVNIDLIIDEYNANDVVFEDEQLVIQMDDFTKDYIGDAMTLDYNTGFKITTPSETIVYGLSLKK